MWLPRLQYLIDREEDTWSGWIAPEIQVGMSGLETYDKTFDYLRPFQFKLYQTAKPVIERFTWANLGHFTILQEKIKCTFDTITNFEDWKLGNYTRQDGIEIEDLVTDDVVIIRESKKGITGAYEFVSGTTFTDLFELTYTNEGLPLNHNQYIVKDTEMNYFKGKTEAYDYWVVTLNLEEPTAWAKKQPISTLSYTNQTEKKVIEDGVTNTYTKDAYTVLTKIERMFKVSPINQDNLDFQYQEGKSLYSKINILDKTWLDSLPFTDDTDSAGDLWTNLNKQEDTIDRTPVLYFDMTLTGQYEMPSLDTEEIIEDNTITFSPCYPDIVFSKADGFTLSGTLVYAYDLIKGKTYYREVDTNIIESFYIIMPVHDLTFKFTYLHREFSTSVATSTHPANPLTPTYALKFDRRDGYDKTELDFDTITTGAEKPIAYSENGEEYATGIRSEVDNMTTGQSIVYPGEGLFTAPQLETDLRTIETSTSENINGKWYIELPFPIKNINAILARKISGYALNVPPSTDVVLYLKRENTDINNEYIMEEQSYKASELYVSDFNSICHFKEGDTKLYLNEYYYNEDEITSIYNIEYEPLIDTIIEQGDNDLTESINQNDSQIENLKFSRFIYNYKNGSSGSDIIFNKFHNHYDEIYPCGSRVINATSGDDYIISKVQYVCMNNKLKASYQLNKDHIRRNLNVSANRQIKPSRAIEYNNLKDRRNLLRNIYNLDVEIVTGANHYIKFTVDDNVDHIPLKLISALCGNSSDERLTAPEIVVVEPVSILNKTGTGLISFGQKFLWVYAKQSNKNQIQYNIMFKDNASISTKKSPQYYNDSDHDLPKKITDIKYLYETLFTNPFGEVDKINLSFKSITSQDLSVYNKLEYSNISEYTTHPVYIEFMKTFKYYIGMASLPVLTAGFNATLSDIMTFYNINVQKDMLELFNLGISFELKTSQKIIACQDLFEWSKLMGNTNIYGLKAQFFNKKKSEFDGLTDGLIAIKDLTAEIISDTEVRNSWVGDTGTYKSIIVTTGVINGEYKKLLIINL